MPIPVALLGIAALTSIASGVSTFLSSGHQARQLKVQMRSEELNERVERIAVQEDLLETLSSNIATAAASGLQPSGTVLRTQEMAQAKAAEHLSLRRAGTRLRTLSLKAEKEQVKRTGEIALASSLLQAFTYVAPTPKKVK